MAVKVQDAHVCPAASLISRTSTAVHGTPLDRFFLSYPSFIYDRSLPPAESFHRLRNHQRWRRGSLESDEGWDKYQKALNEEFRLWYGAENDLDAWHALCRAIGITPLPPTCKGCEKVNHYQNCL